MGVASIPGRLVAWVLRKRNSFPNWVNRCLDYVADNPMSVPGRLASRVLWRFSDADIPAPSQMPPTQPSVYIAPTNYSAQGFAWSRALRSEGLHAVNMAMDVPGGYSFDADRVIPMGVFERSVDWREREFEVVKNYSHVLYEAERPIFSRMFGRDVRAEVKALRDAGVSVAMLAHGTDVRLPSRHARASKWSPFLAANWYLDKHERDARRNIELLRDLGAPTFVSTPDLLDDVPFAHWCPVVVDPNHWACERPVHTGPLRVVHAPTNPRIKGTDLIEPMLERLAAEGVIDYRRIVHVPHAEIPAVFAEADVVLDQFRLGSFGVAACEAMAAGCAVIAHVEPHVRAHVLALGGQELPIVEATPDTLEVVIRGLAADRAEVARLSEAGPRYVRTVHDGTLSATQLRKWWVDADTNVQERPVEAEIVVAVHDPQRQIERAVASVLSSERARALVVAHNTPIEGVRDRLGDLASHPRVRVIELHDGIYSPAGPFNTGLDAVAAAFSGVLGSDDELEPGAVDAWLAAAESHQADVVIARVRDGASRRSSTTPPVRFPRRQLVEGKVDRLSYRSAPLGLFRTDRFAKTRFTAGLASGEDVAFVTELWFSNARIVFPENAPAYLVHDDAPVRVTATYRSIADDMAFLPHVASVVERLQLGTADREAIATKLLRVNVWGLIGNRQSQEWSAAERSALSRAALDVLALSPVGIRSLSLAEARLLTAVLDESVPVEELFPLLSARSSFRAPAAMVPARGVRLFAREAPLRFALASFRLIRAR